MDKQNIIIHMEDIGFSYPNSLRALSNLHFNAPFTGLDEFTRERILIF